ncbi:MAG: NAD(P)/FAD-dependent oxidoreductase [Firmicutes bacterium]|nr:NAD(P)/FAD-dependent oxidoreductase [Bacillota bacterium]
MNYVVVGSSAAGLSAIHAIRKLDPCGNITVVDEESRPAYSRVLLTHYIAGRVAERDLFLVEEAFYRSYGVRTLLGVRATGLDPGRRQLYLADGRVLDYDSLLVATGARAVVPSWSRTGGVTGLRTREDAVRIRNAALAGRRVVIVGGGPVGVKLACALLELGVTPTLLASSPRILSQVADREASLMLEQHLLRHGVRVRCGAEVGEVAAGPRGTEGVVLSDGSTVPCQLLVVCKGVEPRTELVAGHLAVRRGVLVDNGMRTSVPGVYAAGDVAESPDIWGEGTRVSAIWPHAVKQGKVAGTNMAGGRDLFPGVLPRNAMDVLGMPFVSMGLLHVPAAAGWRSVSRRRGNSYLRLVIRGESVVGAVLLGCPQLAGPIQAAIRKGGRGWEQLVPL